MSYIGDIKLGNTFDSKFTTRQISGAPSTLSSSPVISNYVGNGTTELTAGITLTVDFDARTGLNNIRVVATSGNGYATATDNQLVITTGTVNSVSVVGEVVAEYSIENRRADVQFWNGTQVATPATAGIPDVNVKNMNNVSASAITTIKAVQGLAVDGVITTLTNLPAITANWLTAAGTAADFGTEVATAIWTDTTAGDFTVANSIGKSVMNGVALGTGLTVAAVSGSVGSVTGAVGSVTGAVGSVTGAVGSVTARVTANTDQLAGQTVTAAAGVTFPASVASPTNITAGVITTVTNLTNAATAGDLTAAMKTSVENAVWDATMASHVTAGSTGAALNAAGGAGDPWITALPGAYAAGSAGYILGNNLNAKVGDVKLQTDKLTFTVANKLDVNILYVNGIAVTGSGTAGSPWGP